MQKHLAEGLAHTFDKSSNYCYCSVIISNDSPCQNEKHMPPKQERGAFGYPVKGRHWEIEFSSWECTRCSLKTTFGLVLQLQADTFPGKCTNKIVHLCRIMVRLIKHLKHFITHKAQDSTPSLSTQMFKHIKS